MLCRASSNFSFWPATTCSWVCGGGTAGVSRRFPVTTRVLGRRGGCARCSGLTTVMLGRLVVPPPAVCDIAVPLRPSSSDAELERRSVLLTRSFIVPILINQLPKRHQRIRRLPAVFVRRVDSKEPVAHSAWRGDRALIERRQEAGGARGWKAVPADFRWTNSASVVRYRNSIACGSNNSGGVA